MYSILLSFDNNDKVSCKFVEGSQDEKKRDLRVVDITGHPQSKLIDTKNVFVKTNKLAECGKNKLFVVKNQFILNMAKLTALDNSISVLYMRNNNDSEVNHMCMIEDKVNIEYSDKGITV